MNTAPLETDRLLLRPLEAADMAGMFALDSDPAVHRYLGGIEGNMVTEPAQSAAAIAYIQEQYRTAGIGRWAVVLRETGAFMGWAGLKLVREEINGRRDFYDIGYRFRPAYWGQGYGYEAARAWLEHGFRKMQLPQIGAYADAENVASRRILTKIGLREGNDFLDNGTRCVWYEAANPYQL